MIKYNFISRVYGPCIAFAEKKGKWGFVRLIGSSTGTMKIKELTPFVYDKKPIIEDGLIVVSKKGKLGLFGLDYPNQSVKEILKCEYEQIDIQDVNHILVCKDGKYGMKNARGADIVGLEWDYLKYVSSSVIIAARNGKFGVINSFNLVVIPFSYEEISLCGNYLKVRYDGRYGLYSLGGKFILSTEYYDIVPMRFGFAVRSVATWGFIDSKRIKTINCKYEAIEEGPFNTLKVKKKGKWGLMSTFGEVVLPARYRKIESRDVEGYAAVMGNNGKWSFIDTSFNQICLAEFDEVYEFNRELAIVKKNGKYGVINRNGNIVVLCMYDDISLFNSSGYAVVTVGSKSGVIDKKGKEITPIIYDSIDIMQNIAHVVYQGEQGIVCLE